MRTIDLIQNAVDNKTVSVVFEIAIDENTKIPAMLKSLDLLEIQEGVDRKRSKLMADYRADGLDQVESDIDEWNEYLSGRKEALKEQGLSVAEIRDALKDEVRPQSEAHRLAAKYANIFAAREIIPTFLRCPQTGNLLFETAEEKKRISNIVKNDTELMTLIAQKFGELNTKRAEVKDQVKN